MEINEILKLKSDIEKAELEKANLQGQLQSVLSEMKTKFDLRFEDLNDAIEDCEHQMYSLQQEMNELVKKIEKRIK